MAWYPQAQRQVSGTPIAAKPSVDVAAVPLPQAGPATQPVLEPAAAAKQPVALCQAPIVVGDSPLKAARPNVAEAAAQAEFPRRRYL
jgi:hypothetical protein